jgi:D-hexose-6-phosphate mutarotase
MKAADIIRGSSVLGPLPGPWPWFGTTHESACAESHSHLRNLLLMLLFQNIPWHLQSHTWARGCTRFRIELVRNNLAKLEW